MGRRLTKTTPRPPSAEQLLTDLALMATAGLRASIELRAFDMPDLADMLCDHIDSVHAVQQGAAARLRRLAGKTGGA